MKFFSTSEIKAIDKYTIEHEPIPSIELMERAVKAVHFWFVNHYKSSDKPIYIFCGIGNNGGDGLALARLLANKYKVSVFIAGKHNELSPDAQVNYDRLLQTANVSIYILDNNLPNIPQNTIVIDALFGSGLNRPLAGYIANLVQHINESNVTVVSIDIPSGLMGEDNSTNISKNIIKAGHTLSFEMPKLAFMFAENEQYVGQWHILPIGLHPDAIKNTPSNYHYTQATEVALQLKKRTRFSHKGSFGKPLLIAGSYGMMGAAVLASRACYRAGAGLLKVHTPSKGVDVLQQGVPEAIVDIDINEKIISTVNIKDEHNAIAIGPGIGTDSATQEALKNIFCSVKVPMIIDADALNILSQHPNWIAQIPPMSILTPHRKEFERLTGGVEASDYRLLMKQVDFAKQHNVVVVLKGAYTSIATPQGNVHFNSTGNPGMSTAGSGDVLTGILLALLAQGYTSEQSSIIGVLLHGLAGDIATEEMGEEAIIASDIIENIGEAYTCLRVLKNPLSKKD
jgi:NAD(P)H-hydrate epimerase